MADAPVLRIPLVAQTLRDGQLVLGDESGPERHIVDPDDPAAVPHARLFTREQLADQDQAFAKDAELVVSELVTNATRYGAHASPPPEHVDPRIWLSIQCTGTYVRVGSVTHTRTCRSRAPRTTSTSPVGAS